MIDDSADDRLHKLAEEFHRFVNGESPIIEKIETTPEEIAFKFGLSFSQAKFWLKKEPNYLANESLHGHKTNDNFTEPLMTFLLTYNSTQLLRESRLNLSRLPDPK